VSANSRSKKTTDRLYISRDSHTPCNPWDRPSKKKEEKERRNESASRRINSTRKKAEKALEIIRPRKRCVTKMELENASENGKGKLKGGKPYQGIGGKRSRS